MAGMYNKENKYNMVGRVLCKKIRVYNLMCSLKRIISSVWIERVRQMISKLWSGAEIFYHLSEIVSYRKVESQFIFTPSIVDKAVAYTALN